MSDSSGSGANLMPRVTAKYRSAITVAHNRGLPTLETANQYELYDLLQKNGYFWNLDSKEWVHHDAAQADPPTPLVMVRVWADLDHVEAYAQQITEKCTAKIGPLVEKSKVYPNRPPKQLEGRVYLKFMPKEQI